MCLFLKKVKNGRYIYKSVKREYGGSDDKIKY